MQQPTRHALRLNRTAGLFLIATALTWTAACSSSGSQSRLPFVAPPRAPWTPPPAAQTPAAEAPAAKTAAAQTPAAPPTVEATPVGAPTAPVPPAIPAAVLPQPARTPAVPAPAPVVSHAQGVTVRVRVTDRQGTRVIALPLDTYVLGCVRAELAPDTLKRDVAGRVLQTQAIVSRTYAMANLDRHKREGFDVCDSTHCQMFRAPLATEHEGDYAARAVAATTGQIVTFNGAAIQAVFHADCGGHTAAAEHVWNDAVPYLRPVPDWFCSRAGHSEWAFDADEAGLRRALDGDPRTTPGARLDRIDIAERDAAGRARLIRIAGERTQTVKAEILRAVLRRHFGPHSMRSTWFSVQRDGASFRFTGLGYGHGVGLCQQGAALRAEAGQTPTAILAHYFPGTRIQTLPALASRILGPRPIPSH